MSRIRAIRTTAVAGLVAAGLSVAVAGNAQAHCDSVNGPVIPEAQAALQQGDVTPVLKWVGEKDEAEIRAAFDLSVAVRATGPAARELADRHFLETLVRLHRAGEGAPYSGIKDAPVEPIVAMADAALAGGSAEHLIERVSHHLAEAIRERFAKAVETGRYKDESVTAGRAFVAAYVSYVHYLENVHAAMVAAGSHPAGPGPAVAGHGH